MSRIARAGITLTEVLVVIAIVAVAIGLMLPATRRVRPAAARMKCQSQLKQLMLALHSFHDVYSSPKAAPYSGLPTGCVGPGTTPEARLSWLVAVLPYMEQDPLYKTFVVAKGYEGNLESARSALPWSLCPSTPDGRREKDSTSYIALAGLGRDAAKLPAGAPGVGFMGYDRPTSMASITDGAANTVALMDTHTALGPWARGGPSTVRGFDPADLPLTGDGRPFATHEGAMNVAMADGSIRSVKANVDPNVLARAITIAGGEDPPSW